MRILKKVLLYTTIIAVSIPAILVVFGFIFQDRIVKQVITELNKSLNSEIKVNQIEFSLISHFPQASINLGGITGYESKEYSSQPDTLFNFQNLSLTFNVLDVIQSNFVLQSITVNHGYVNLEVNKSGISNFMIVKSDTSNSSSFFLSLEEVNMEDCLVSFRDFGSRDEYSFYLPEMVAAGTFSSTYITTTLLGETEVRKLILDKTPYLSNELGNVDIGVEIDLEKHIFKITKGFVTLRDKYVFDVHGESVPGNYSYSFKAKSLDLRQAETLIPKKHIAFIKTYEINGTANVVLELSKKANSKHPSITGQFDLWDGVFIHKQTGESVKIAKAKGKFDMGAKAAPVSTTIWVNEFELSTPEANAKGEFAIVNLKHPWFRIETTGNLDLLELSKLYDFEKDFTMSGNADFDIKLKGSIQSIDSITDANIKGFKINSKITLGNVNLAIVNVPEISNLNAQLLLNQEVLVIEDFTGLVANSSTSGIIQARNWIYYLVDQSRNLEIKADISTDKIETAIWQTNSNEGDKEFSLPSKIKFSAHVNAKEFVHKETYLTNLRTNVKYEPHKLTLSETYFDAYEGAVKAEFQMAQKVNSIQYNFDLAIQSMNVQKLLSTYNNFGQTAVTDKHMRGNLSTGFTLSMTSNRDFEVDNSSMVLEGDFILLNGEMIENELLTQIPSQIESNKIIDLFVNLDAFEKRLHHIKFDTLSNHLSLKNSVLTIPKMHISSSALQIDISGTHSFTNEIDYYLSFNLKEVLTKKKKINSDYGYIQDDGLGNRMMFLHLYTKKGEVQVDLDKEGARKYRQSNSVEEVNVTKSILKDEFGFFKNDTTIKATEPIDNFEYEIDLGEFADDSSSVDMKSDSLGLKKDSTNIKKKKKKKTKKEEEEEFEEFDFEDDDY